MSASHTGDPARDRLDRFNAAIPDMSTDEAHSFDSSFIGAISYYVTDRQWDRAVEIAKDGILEARKRRGAGVV
jgi:hypothetical protein